MWGKPQNTFNRYTLDWDPDRIDISFNGRLVRSIVDEEILENLTIQPKTLLLIIWYKRRWMMKTHHIQSLLLTTLNIHL